MLIYKINYNTHSIYIIGFILKIITKTQKQKKHWFTPDGTRTHSPRLRRPMPYPLGHRGGCIIPVNDQNKRVQSCSRSKALLSVSLKCAQYSWTHSD